MPKQCLPMDTWKLTLNGTIKFCEVIEMLILWNMISMQVYTFQYLLNYLYIIYVFQYYRKDKTIIMSLSTDGTSAHQSGAGGKTVGVRGLEGHQNKAYLVTMQGTYVLLETQVTSFGLVWVCTWSSMLWF